MEYKLHALQTLRAAETAIATLVREAVDHGRYEEIPQLADIARSLAELRERHDPAVSAPDEQQIDPHPPLAETHRQRSGGGVPEQAHARRRGPLTKRGTTPIPSDLPRFEREDNKLIKVGWSARDGKTYEHRVPKSVLDIVAAELMKQTQARKPFKMEKLVPIKDSLGGEIPSYQAYLVLKWLQEARVVERRGNDGYLFSDRNFTETALNELWDKTPQRALPLR